MKRSVLPALASLAAALLWPGDAVADPVTALRAERTGDGGARFVGDTALAAGKRLRLAVHHPESGYRGRSGPVTVSAGTFDSGPMHDHGFPLPAGTYRVRVLTPGKAAGLTTIHRGTARLGPMSRTGRAVALLGTADFSADCKYPTDPLRANFDHFFASGYDLQVKAWRLFTGADDVERLLLAFSFGGRGRSEAIWEVDLGASRVDHANTAARRLSCL